MLGKHSGRHAFADTLEKMGITLQGDALNAAFARFKELADRKVQLTDADLEAIVAEETGQGVRRPFDLVDIELPWRRASTPIGHRDARPRAARRSRTSARATA